MYLLEIKADFGSKEKAKKFYKSIKPELDEEFLRSSTKVAQKDAVLDFKISAADKTALRASLNSLMKPLILFESLEELA
ncbi:MAG: KEOPS complex subunit Pcc1 [archaeon]